MTDAIPTPRRHSAAVTCLQWTLGIVVLVEAGLFTFTPGSAAGFAKTHIHYAVRLFLGWGEIVGAVLFLIPRTAVQGAWLLLVIFVLAIAIHLLHGMPNGGALVVYAAVAWTVASLQGNRKRQ